MIWRDNEVNPPDPTLAAYICLTYKDLTLDEQFLDERTVRNQITPGGVPSGLQRKSPA
jgi:hypothetical protein